MIHTASTILDLHFELIIYIVTALSLLFAVCYLYPYHINKELLDTYPKKRFDERNTMFSRKELVPGSEKYMAYYKNYPEHEMRDKAFRTEPGLLSPDSMFYHERAFKAAQSYFSRVEKLHQSVVGKVNPEKTNMSSMELTRKIKRFASDSGALNAGIVLTRPYHFYSHKGRGEEYGIKIKIEHSYAIAFTVEMNLEMVQAAPHASIIMESAKQYLNTGNIAIRIADLIRDMGYNARAHIDGNYQVICPLVARDAGLGEIGRMGLLMTPLHGPRVRIGVVTTDMELQPDKYTRRHDVIDFCRMCKKCAVCCPGQSIPHGDPLMIDGIKRWQIDSESCYTYWCKAGTDCGRCMSVCPYSHPDRLLHRIIRRGVRYSKLFRYLAMVSDDVIYGRKPSPKPIPEWLENHIP